MLQLTLAEAAFEEGPRVNPRSGMALEEHLVARLAAGLPLKKWLKPDFVKRRRGGEGGQVAADAIGDVVRPHDHDGGVPAHVGPDPALGLLVARERGFLVWRGSC